MADGKKIQSPGDPSFASDARGEVEKKLTWRRAAGWWLLLSVLGSLLYLIPHGNRLWPETLISSLVCLIVGLRWLRREASPPQSVLPFPSERTPGNLWSIVFLLMVVYAVLVVLFTRIQPPPKTCIPEPRWSIILGHALLYLILVSPFFLVAWIRVRQIWLPSSIGQISAALGGGAMALTRFAFGGMVLAIIVMCLPSPFPALDGRWREHYAAAELFRVWCDGYFPDWTYAHLRHIPELNFRPDTVCVLLGPFSLLLASAARAFYEIRRTWAPRFGWQELPPWPFK